MTLKQTTNAPSSSPFLHFHPANTTSKRTAALKVDWTKISTSLALRGQTVASLQSFKKRNEDARRRVALLSGQPTTVDFAAYRAQLGPRGQAVVDELEKRVAAFKPASYDVQRQVKAIEAFEAEAVRNAEETKGLVREQVEALEKTLQNIESARPFDELTVVSADLWRVERNARRDC